LFPKTYQLIIITLDEKGRTCHMKRTHKNLDLALRDITTYKRKNHEILSYHITIEKRLV